MSQSTDAPSGFRKSLKFDVTTAETGGVAADEYGGNRYITESQDVARFVIWNKRCKNHHIKFSCKSLSSRNLCLK